jgi:hypothetical protein
MKRLRARPTSRNSPMNRDAPRPQQNRLHGGTHLAMGRVHEGVQPRQYGLHGGTAAPMGVLKKRKFT